MVEPAGHRGFADLRAGANPRKIYSKQTLAGTGWTNLVISLSVMAWAPDESAMKSQSLCRAGKSTLATVRSQLIPCWSCSSY